MKTCRNCNETKDWDQFHVSKTNCDGLNHECKSCRNKEQAKKYRDNWFHKYSLVKRSECKQKGIPFDLTGEYLEEIWTDTCPVFGVEFVRHDKRHGACPALDRVDPTLGYVKGNVKWISSRANRIKYDASAEELKKVLDYVEGATTIPQGSTLK